MVSVRQFLGLFYVIACVSNANSMEDTTNNKVTLKLDAPSYVQANREFLEKQILVGKNNQNVQLLRYLLTGLMVQDEMFTSARRVYQEGCIVEEKNKTVLATLCAKDTFLPQEQFLKPLDVGTEKVFSVEVPAQTKAGIKALLKHGKHIRHLCDQSCNVLEVVKSLQQGHKKTSEPYYYGQLLLHRYESRFQASKYQEARQSTENLYKAKIEEHQSRCLNIINLNKQYREVLAQSVNSSQSSSELCIVYKKPLLAKLWHLVRSFDDHTSYEEDFILFSPHQEELRNLYKLGVEKLNQIKEGKKQNRDSIKNFNTLEKEPKPFLASLDPKPVAQSNSLHEKNSSTKKKKNKKNSVQEKQPVITSLDGSYVDKKNDNELLIVHPKVKTKVTLYPINSEEFPVLVDFKSLICTNNICQWNDDPEKALFLQGYTNAKHKYYTSNKNEQNRMIYIHALPQEMKKHTKKYAQQTMCDSWLHSGQKDIQITFCGELTYPSGITKTGLFIYLIDGTTNRLYHHMFEESSYEKTFKKYMEQGNFNNAFDKVFFPELKDIN